MYSDMWWEGMWFFQTHMPLGEKKDHCFEWLLLCIQMRWEGEYGSFRNKTWTLGSLFLVIVSMCIQIWWEGGYCSFRNIIENKDHYRISEIFCVSLIFAEFVTFLKSPKIDTGTKINPIYTPLLRVLEMAKIELCEYPSKRHFRKNSRREKFPRCGISSDCFDVSAVMGRWGMALSDTS